MHNAIQLYFMIRFLIDIADNRHDYMSVLLLAGFPGGSDGKESTGNAGDPGSISELGRSPREGNGSPLQSSCQENSKDRGTWWATDHGVCYCRQTIRHS